MSRSYGNHAAKLLLTIGFACTLTTPASAQMANNPWSFQQQNRASVAALIRQVEREKSNGTGYSQGAASNLVCGSDGRSSASGNSTCVILNNSTGHIEIGQDAQGDQTASSNTDTHTDVQTTSNADDVLAALTTQAAP